MSAGWPFWFDLAAVAYK